MFDAPSPRIVFVRRSTLALSLGAILGLIASSEASAQGADLERRLVGPDPSQKATHQKAPGSIPTGAAPRPKILLTGYWPPTNEMIRRFSTNPAKNPQGWIGSNWENRGYDVHAYFPEFSPPTCSSCGKGTGDLEVDYQDTSNDFWSIANGLDPIAVITFSRGKVGVTWEAEMNQYNRATWINDYLAPLQPTPAPPDASVPAGYLRLSTLPVQDIVNDVAAANLGLSPYICFTQDGGGFLSEFIAYHGVWYQSIHESPTADDWCVAAGHVHVGTQISWPVATLAAEVTLRSVIDHVDSIVAATVCQTDLGYGGPGNATLKLCGAPLGTGGVADLRLANAPPSTPIVFFAGAFSNPSPLGLGTFVPLPFAISFSLPTNPQGEILIEGVPGGGGPVNVYLQALYADGTLQGGIGFSNALQIQLLP